MIEAVILSVFTANSLVPLVKLTGYCKIFQKKRSGCVNYQTIFNINALMTFIAHESTAESELTAEHESTSSLAKRNALAG